MPHIGRKGKKKKKEHSSNFWSKFLVSSFSRGFMFVTKARKCTTASYLLANSFS